THNLIHEQRCIFDFEQELPKHFEWSQLCGLCTCTPFTIENFSGDVDDHSFKRLVATEPCYTRQQTCKQRQIQRCQRVPASIENVIGFSVPEEHCHFILMHDKLGTPCNIFIWVPPNYGVWTRICPFYYLWHFNSLLRLLHYVDQTCFLNFQACQLHSGPW